MITEWNKLVGLLNRGYGYNYVAHIFNCSPEFVKEFEKEQKARGVYIKEFEVRIEIEFRSELPSENKNNELSIESTDSLANTEQTAEVLSVANIPDPRKRVTLEEILGNFTSYFKFSKEELEEHTRRNAELMEARNIIIYLLRKYGEMSFPAIGALLNRDHTTIIYSYGKMKNKVETNPDYEKNFSALIQDALSLKGQWKKSSWSIPRRTLEIQTGSEINTGDRIITFHDDERINVGKSSYKKYLQEYKNEIKESRSSRIAQARETIENLRKWRKKNGVKEPYSRKSIFRIRDSW